MTCTSGMRAGSRSGGQSCPTGAILKWNSKKNHLLREIPVALIVVGRLATALAHFGQRGVRVMKAEAGFDSNPRKLRGGALSGELLPECAPAEHETRNAGLWLGREGDGNRRRIGARGAGGLVPIERYGEVLSPPSARVHQAELERLRSRVNFYINVVVRTDIPPANVRARERGMQESAGWNQAPVLQPQPKAKTRDDPVPDMDDRGVDRNRDGETCVDVRVHGATLTGGRAAISKGSIRKLPAAEASRRARGAGCSREAERRIPGGNGKRGSKGDL